MKIRVYFADKTHATITWTPSWITRLFGRQRRAATVHRSTTVHYTGRQSWVFTTTDREVNDDIYRILEQHEVANLVLPRAVARDAKTEATREAAREPVNHP